MGRFLQEEKSILPAVSFSGATAGWFICLLAHCCCFFCFFYVKCPCRHSACWGIGTGEFAMNSLRKRISCSSATKGHHSMAILAKVQPVGFLLRAELAGLSMTVCWLYSNVFLTGDRDGWSSPLFSRRLKLHSESVLHHKWDGSTCPFYHFTICLPR